MTFRPFRRHAAGSRFLAALPVVLTAAAAFFPSFVFAKDPTELAKAAAALKPGQSADFPAGAQSAFSQADLEWQTAFYHDDLHGVIHLMGKPANADKSWKHQYYTVATNAWTVESKGMWNNSGHVYGNLAMDFTTGDLFLARSTAGKDAPRRLRWWRQATGDWAVAPVNQDIFTGAMDSHANGVCYHPDLYGPGDGGAIWNESGNVHFWRKKTDAVETVRYKSGAYGDKESAAVYWPAQNAALLGSSLHTPLLRITPNPTAGGTPVLTAMAVPPIDVAGHSRVYSKDFGSLHVHPGNPNKLLIVETVGPRAWTSTDGSHWTAIENHPFTFPARVVCSLRGGLGCLWAVGNSGSAQHSMLWKPQEQIPAASTQPEKSGARPAGPPAARPPATAAAP